MRAFVVVLTLVLTFASTMSAQAPVRPSAEDLSGAMQRAASLAGPAVVEIFTTAYKPGEGVVARSSDLITTERGSGSGVIVDPDGYIVTNAHVVRGATRLRVELPSAAAGRSILATRGRVVDARLVGIDVETDLAVVKVDERNLPALAFGDSDDLRPGQMVLAFGSPLGLHNSVSLGIVSAVARQLQPDSPMIYVQTDASINPGSSGGPLVDLSGRIVGLNTLIASRTGGSDGLGFSAPSNIVRTIYEQIKQFGRVHRGDIGVRAQTVTPLLAAGLALPADARVIVSDVETGSPAASAGLRSGDLILAIDGKPMENSRHFQVNLYRRFAGARVVLDIKRDGQSLRIPVTIVERPNPFASLTAAVDPRRNLVARLGVLGVELDARVAAMMPSSRVSSGVLVVTTAAAEAGTAAGGLTAGDVIFGINRKPVATLTDLRAILDAMKAGDAVVLQVERRGEVVFLAFTLE